MRMRILNSSINWKIKFWETLAFECSETVSCAQHPRLRCVVSFAKFSPSNVAPRQHFRMLRDQNILFRWTPAMSFRNLHYYHVDAHRWRFLWNFFGIDDAFRGCIYVCAMFACMCVCVASRQRRNMAAFGGMHRTQIPFESCYGSGGGDEDDGRRRLLPVARNTNDILALDAMYALNAITRMCAQLQCERISGAAAMRSLLTIRTIGNNTV